MTPEVVVEEARPAARLPTLETAGTGDLLRHMALSGGIVAVFLLLLVALIDTAGGIGRPFGGYTLNTVYGVVDNPAPGASDLGGPRPSDRLLLVDGQSPTLLGDLFEQAARAGRPLQYRVARRDPNGQLTPLTVSGGTTIFHLSHWLQIYGAGLLLATVWWALGTFLYVVGRHRRIHQLFLALSLMLSALLVGDLLGSTYTYQTTPLGGTLFAPLYALMMPLCGAALLRLSSYFPLTKPAVLSHPRWGLVVYAIGGALGLFNAILTALRAHPLDPVTLTLAPLWWQWVSSAALLYTVFAVLMLAAGLGYDRRRTHDPIVRRQVRIVGLGLLCGVLPQVLGELLPIALRMRPLVTQSVGYVFLIAAPVALAYAIVRYRLFDISRVMQTGVAYLVVSSILLGVYFLLVTALQALLRELTGGSSDLVAIVSTVGVAVLFAPLIARGQQATERVLFRERFLLRQALRDFGAQVATGYELDPLADALVDEIRRLLRVPAAALYLCRDESGDTRRLERVRARGPMLSSTRALIAVPAGWVQATVARPAAVDLDLPGLRGAAGEMWHDLHHEGVALVLPLVAGGDLVGVLLLGRKAGQTGFLREELEVLEALAGQAALALRNAQLLQDRSEQVRLRSELDIARTIQQRLLPAQVPDLPGLEIAAECLPAQETSGDSYDLLTDDAGTLHVVVSDACGKNLSAAMLIALSRNTLRGALQRTGDPAAALSETNRVLTPDLGRGQFLAVSCATISAGPQRGVCVANGGQMYPMLARCAPDGTAQCDFVETPLPRLPLGLVADLAYSSSPAVALQAGDLLVCYSDGLVDVCKSDGTHFGFDRLADLLRSAAQAGYSAADTLALILAAAATWGDLDTPQDDITAVVVRVR
ncbi:MAG: SpoIIE family protein phosphatase [Chloroflexota bacterium]|nr:SpoIIE family protein phosphatase [Chloroflexota bacterium]